MTRTGQLEQRVAERDARIAELEAQLRCPIGSEPLVCSAGTCVECRVLRASDEMKERCARIAYAEALIKDEGVRIAAAIRSQDDG